MHEPPFSGTLQTSAPEPAQDGGRFRRVCRHAALSFSLVVGLAWVYGGVLGGLFWEAWFVPDQVHRFAVPVLALALLWIRRDQLVSYEPRGSRWGLLLLIVAGGLQWASVWTADLTLHVLSLLPCLAGLVWFVWGWQALRWAAPSIACLVLLGQLPESWQSGLSGSLQRLTTVLTTGALQTLGFPAFCEGNSIVLRDSQVGVSEACSGIRTLGFCLAATVAVSLVMEHGPVVKSLVIASALPVALLANVSRITVIAICHETLPRRWAEGAGQDLVGWCTTPCAMCLLFAELAFLSWIWRTSRLV